MSKKEEQPDNIQFTTLAQKYLKDLLEQQQDQSLNAIVFYVEHQGTPKAETCLSFFNQDDCENLIPINFEQIIVFVDQLSIAYLKDSTVDYIYDDLGGEIKITAPNAKKRAYGNELDELINDVIEKEINPQLNLHSGSIILEKINETNDTIYITLQGGCQGCSMAQSTLVEFIEKIIVEKIPQIVCVQDITNHAIKDNAYF